MRKRWIGIIAIFIAVLILLSFYIDVIKKPEIETISLESLGIDRITQSILSITCDGHNLVIVEDNLVQEEWCSRAVIFNLTTKEHEEITDKIYPRRFQTLVPYGDLLVWSDGWDIYGYNIKTQENFPISRMPYEKEYAPDIYDKMVVWLSVEWDAKGRVTNPCIYGYNLKTGERFKIADEVDPTLPPFVSDNYVVWARKNKDRDIYGRDFYGYDLKEREEFPICLEEGNPRILDLWKDRLLYEDEAINSTYVYNLTTGGRRLIENEEDVKGIRMWEDYVALSLMEYNGDNFEVQNSLYIYNMTTGEKRLIYKENGAIPEELPGEPNGYLFSTNLEMSDGVLVWMRGGYTHKNEHFWTDLHYTRI